MSPRPKQTSQPSDLRERIMTTAWEQIATQGASGLSLRAIARTLNITAPAIYNYFPRRDDLVTAMIIEAFSALGESQRAAIAGLPEMDLVARFSSLGLAYRQWAMDFPQHYQLIFGTPIPGYHAPAERTVPAAAQSLLPLIETVQTLFDMGRLRTETVATMSPELGQMFAAWQATGLPAEAEALYLALVFWSRVHGLVSIEVGEQFPAFITDPGEIFRREIKNMVNQYIIGE